MRIDNPTPEPVLYEDYDITFANGMTLPISISKSLGDTVDFDTSPLSVIFHLAEKASPSDDEVRIPPEDITIFMTHVLSIARRTRTIIPPTQEQKDQFRQAYHQLNKTVQ